ncbi:hypothetical protein [Bradyrhizobium sp. Gha]|uniref:hypothetical protein n=1 Tax=Bradyrhizobium sp. Gha TaxID=1855318 RepID=UPI0008E4CF1B|nr:hypothetical protein [Bradyrhizobium sp. Gha]SFJ59874.1 hypothetical protein SAMN05216525_12954 [Bradyrhizobium sp. Gha]
MGTPRRLLSADNNLLVQIPAQRMTGVAIGQAGRRRTFSDHGRHRRAGMTVDRREEPAEDASIPPVRELIHSIQFGAALLDTQQGGFTIQFARLHEAEWRRFWAENRFSLPSWVATRNELLSADNKSLGLARKWMLSADNNLCLRPPARACPR